MIGLRVFQRRSDVSVPCKPSSLPCTAPAVRLPVSRAKRATMPDVNRWTPGPRDPSTGFHLRIERVPSPRVGQYGPNDFPAMRRAHTRPSFDCHSPSLTSVGISDPVFDRSRCPMSCRAPARAPHTCVHCPYAMRTVTRQDPQAGPHAQCAPLQGQRPGANNRSKSVPPTAACGKRAAHGTEAHPGQVLTGELRQYCGCPPFYLCSLHSACSATTKEARLLAGRTSSKVA